MVEPPLQTIYNKTKSPKSRLVNVNSTMKSSYKQQSAHKKRTEVKPSLRSSRNESLQGPNSNQVKVESSIVTPAKRSKKIPTAVVSLNPDEY